MNMMLKLTITFVFSCGFVGMVLAQNADAQPLSFFEPMLLVGFVAIFYFLIWRPQNKRSKAHRELVAGLGKDDEVVTSGGMMGTIVKVEEDMVRIRVADKVEVVFQRQAISTVLPKGTLKAKQLG